MQKLKQDFSIGSNLTNLRHKARLSQEQVAAQLQVCGCSTTRSVYSKMETGSYPIRISELIALQKIFDCQFNDFFVGVGQ